MISDWPSCHPMITENEKAPQIRVKLLPSSCNVNFINQEHAWGQPLSFQPRMYLQRLHRLVNLIKNIFFWNIHALYWPLMISYSLNHSHNKNWLSLIWLLQMFCKSFMKFCKVTCRVVFWILLNNICKFGFCSPQK